MSLWVFNKEHEAVAIIDNYKSLIWSNRFVEAGDFELCMSATDPMAIYFKQDYYVWYDAPHNEGFYMIVENVKLDTDIDDGLFMIVSGRSLESLLERRIVWRQTTFNNVTLLSSIERLMNENILSPSDSKRKISNFIFKKPEDKYFVNTRLDTQFTGQDLHEAMKALCENFDFGYRVTFDKESMKFILELFRGIDRTYSQDENPYVIFSPDFDNLRESSYLTSSSLYKTVTLVAGEGEGSSRKTTIVESSEGALDGIYRRELFTDAREISSQTENGSISSSDYTNKLKAKGIDQLREHSIKTLFDGQVDYERMFVYGEDFFLGDIVQLENEFGITAMARITEVIYSNDESGNEMYPTFVVNNEK